jgi:tetratricopeptide (TPR) repeat protein
MDLKQFQKAVWDFDEAIQFKPQFAEAFLQRGLCYGHMNNSQHAQADLEVAEKIAKGSLRGEQALSVERAELLEKIAAARQQLNHAVGVSASSTPA